MNEHALQEMIELAGRELRHVAKLYGGGFTSLELVQWIKRHPQSALFQCFSWAERATDKQRAKWFDAAWYADWPQALSAIRDRHEASNQGDEAD